MHEEHWSFDNTNVAEQYNVLLMLDKSFENKEIAVRPVFHILGGTALLFHGISAVVTIDIDTANALTDEIKEVVEPFISDNASDVATLAKNYEQRMLRYFPDIFKNIDVYYLSIEDLVITKLGAGRAKDIEDLTKTDLLQKCDMEKLLNIMITELPSETCSLLSQRLDKLM